MPSVGEILPLSHQLLDGSDDKFVRAILLEVDGTPLASSPVSMPNIGFGKYSTASATMPNIPRVECTYETFEDSLFTIPSDFKQGTDVFVKELVLARLDALSEQTNLVGIVEPNELVGVVVDEEELIGIVDDPDLIGIVEND